MNFRELTSDDAEALIALRSRTRENTLSREALSAMGITAPSVQEKMKHTHARWCCEAEGRIVGFAMAEFETGELWVIAVLPEYEDRGIGGRLLDRVERALWERGIEEMWLTTSVEPGLRAYGFYRNQFLRFCKVGVPDWAVVTGSGPSSGPVSGNLSLNPGANDAGTHQVVIWAIDGGSCGAPLGGHDAKTVTVHVAPRNSPPLLAAMGARQMGEGETDVLQG